MGVIAVFMTTASRQANAMQDCSYYKMQPAEFIETVNSFVDRVQDTIQSRPNLSQSAFDRGKLTVAMYELGVLQGVPDCNHDPNGSNIEVVGGDALGVIDGADTSASGFTVIIRGLPTSLCRSMLASSSPNRPVKVRPEVPRQLPGPVGNCVGNPFAWGLPMPNTAYIYQRIALPAPIAPPPTGHCVVHPDDRQLLDNAGDKSTCGLVQSGQASAIQIQQCNDLTEKVRRQIQFIKSIYSASVLASLGFEQRLALLRPMFQTQKTPSDPSIEEQRLDLAMAIFTPNGEMNIDQPYWEHELKAYDQIATAIHTVACQKNWNHLFNPLDPSTPMASLQALEWMVTRAPARAEVVVDIASAFTSVKDIGNTKLYVDQTGELSAALKGRNGVYIPVGAILPEGLTDQHRGSVIITKAGYLYAGQPVTLRHTLETILEEMMHAHQHHITGQYTEGTLENSSHACNQAGMFLMNAVAAAKNTVGIQIPFVWKHPSLIIYESQPLEVHAKKFAKHVTDKLLAGNTLTCPGP